MRRLTIAATTLVGLTTSLSAQAARAAATITAADFKRRVFIIADDSMGGRATPSPGLDATAAYVAREFERIGLVPAGDSGSYFQRYGIRLREVDAGGSSLKFLGDAGQQINLSYGTDAKPLFGAPRETETVTPFVLLGGPLTLTSKVDRAALKGRAIVWAPPKDYGQTFVAVVSLATSIQAPFVILVMDDDSAFAKLPAPKGEVVTAETVGWPAVIAVRQSSVTAQVPEAADQLGQIRAASDVVTFEPPGWTVTAHTAFSRDERRLVPNVIGMVKGTDPRLAAENVIVTAHMDHVGSQCRGADGPDKICNGANDNASGTTGVLELAEAFADKAARPKRTMIFAIVSGEERGLWGSQYAAEHPPVPIDKIVANVNMDHLGRNWKDSIAVIGLDDSDLGQTARRVEKAHRELKIGILPDQWPKEQIYFRSDHYNFAKLGVPILFFTNGFHVDYHAVTDSPDKLDPESASRVLRLMFYILLDVANAPGRPQWNPESKARVVTGPTVQ